MKHIEKYKKQTKNLKKENSDVYNIYRTPVCFTATVCFTV